MAAIGVFSDCGGDLEAFDAALKLLAGKGAQRFFFSGGRYEDLDAWVLWKRDELRAHEDYSDADFLEDVSRHLMGLPQVERPAAFGTAYEASRAIESLTRLKAKVLRVPERGSPAYKDASISKKVMDLLGETLCCLVHDRNDLNKEDLTNAVVLVHGNEPEPKVVHIGPRVFVTAGRLKGGVGSAVGLLEVVERQVFFSAFALDGTPLLEKQALVTGGKTKVSVK